MSMFCNRYYENPATVTARSATDAINWVVTQGVDIISISWSINADRNLKDLEKALSAAHNADIIMLSSSIVRGSSIRDNTYPGKEKNCIKIGASTTTGETTGETIGETTGEKLTWVFEESEFLLPGGARKWSYRPLEPDSIYISTALATGLAGLILFYERLLSKEDNSKGVDQLRQLGEMRNVFKALSKGADRIFVDVREYFDLEFQNMVWGTERDVEETKRAKKRLERS